MVNINVGNWLNTEQNTEEYMAISTMGNSSCADKIMSSNNTDFQELFYKREANLVTIAWVPGDTFSVDSNTVKFKLIQVA